MYKCKDCGEVFEKPREIKEHHSELEGNWCETFYECPFCGSGGYEEAKECEDCGDYFLESELIEGLCMECCRNIFIHSPHTMWDIVQKESDYVEWLMSEYKYETDSKYREAEDARRARVKAYHEAHREHDEFVSNKVSSAVALARHDAKEQAEREWNELHKEKTV